VGCAAKSGLVESVEIGVVMKYQAATEQPLKYQYSHKFAQKLEVAGKEVEMSGNQSMLYSMSVRPKNNNLELDVTVEAASFAANSPMGEMTADMSEVIGSKFVMLLSPVGKELDLGKAATITFGLAPGETRSLAFEMGSFFPNLPDRPLKIGESWTSVDTISEKSGDRELTIALDSKNKLVGIEKINGRECLRIATESTGTMTGTGQQQGVPLTTNATITASDVWFFDPVAGVYVKSESTGTAEGSIEAKGPQPMTIPMRNQFSFTISLVK
jgi:hypothetical protein